MNEACYVSVTRFNAAMSYNKTFKTQPQFHQIACKSTIGVIQYNPQTRSLLTSYSMWLLYCWYLRSTRCYLRISVAQSRCRLVLQSTMCSGLAVVGGTSMVISGVPPLSSRLISSLVSVFLSLTSIPLSDPQCCVFQCCYITQEGYKRSLHSKRIKNARPSLQRHAFEILKSK